MDIGQETKDRSIKLKKDFALFALQVHLIKFLFHFKVTEMGKNNACSYGLGKNHDPEYNQLWPYVKYYICMCIYMF